MDDARLADEMTLDGIAKQLKEIRADLSGVKADLGGVKADLGAVKADLGAVKSELGAVKDEMKAGFNASKIRDEELRSLAKLGLEANQGLLESTTARFDATDQKHGEEISLLKAVQRSSVKRRPRRRP